MASYLAPLWGKKSVIDINFNRIDHSSRHVEQDYRWAVMEAGDPLEIIVIGTGC